MRVNERTAEVTRKTQELTAEVTGHKKAEAAVRETEEKYGTLFDSRSDGIAITTLDGKIVDVNQDYQDMVGYTLKELEGTNFQELTPKKWHKLEAAAMKDFMSEGYGTFEKEYIRKDGTIFPVSVSAWLIRDRQGNPAGIGAFVKDITERKKAEKALKESEEKYRTQFEQAMDAIFIADAETGIVVDCNRAACKLVGRKKSEIVGQHQRILHPPQETNGDTTRTFKKHLREKEGQTLETQVITKKGEIKEVAIKANVLEISGKKLLQGIFGISPRASGRRNENTPSKRLKQ